MKQHNLFDIDKARARKNAGMSEVAENNKRFMQVARDTARQIAARQGSVTMDDVRRECPWEPLHPNAWGSVFKGADFEWTGHYSQSTNESRHGGMQRVWRLKQ